MVPKERQVGRRGLCYERMMVREGASYGMGAFTSESSRGAARWTWRRAIASQDICAVG